MIGEDRELLAELTRFNGDMVSLSLRIMEGSDSVGEQVRYAKRLIAAGERLRRRTAGMGRAVVEGEVVVDGSLVLPGYTVEPPPWSRE